MKQKAGTAGRGYIRVIALCLLTFFLTIFVSRIIPRMFPGAERTRALFLETGLLDFERTTSFPIDAGTEGMFGSLLDYLSALGVSSTRTRGPFTDELLRSADILFVINSTYEWTPEELTRIHRWVESGGALIVLGDHTDLAFMTRSINPLIAPYNGKLNFETGDMSKPLLRHEWKVQHDPILFRVASYMQIYWGTGGTLSISYPLLPLITGLNAFGDGGDYTANSYFGNRKYDPGERADDITLAAYADVGKGKVLVCADTSPFLNGCLHLSFYPFLYDLFGWIRWGPAWSGEQYFRWAAGLILILLLASNLRSRGTVRLLPLLIGISAGLVVAHRYAPPPFHLEREHAPVALIDLTHLPYFAADPFHDHSLDGAAGMFLRAELLPVAMWHYDRSMIESAGVLLIQQPAIAYSSGEMEEIYGWVERGGLLILTGTYNGSAAVNEFIERLHLRIGEIPLGAAVKTAGRGGGEQYLQIPNTAPITFSNPSEALPVRLATEVLLENEGYPVAVRIRYGKGHVVLIASDRFLTSQSLQDKENPSRVQNVQWLISLVQGQPGARR